MIGLFVDIPNIFYNCRKKYGAKVDYQLVYDFIQMTEPGSIHRAIAYGFQLSDEAVNFITCMKHIGFETKWIQLDEYSNQEMKKVLSGGEIKHNKYDLGVTIAMDVVRMNRHFRTIVLMTNDIAMIPLIDWIQEQGNRVIVIACRIPIEIKTAVNKWIEIPEQMIVSKEMLLSKE